MTERAEPAEARDVIAEELHKSYERYEGCAEPAVPWDDLHSMHKDECFFHADAILAALAERGYVIQGDDHA